MNSIATICLLHLDIMKGWYIEQMIITTILDISTYITHHKKTTHDISHSVEIINKESEAFNSKNLTIHLVLVLQAIRFHDTTLIPYYHTYGPFCPHTHTPYNIDVVPPSYYILRAYFYFFRTEGAY